MSCAANPRFKQLDPNDGEKFRLGLDAGDEEDFDFQYVPVDQFKHIIKDVRRQRVRDEEERVWTTFLREKEQAVSNYQQNYDGPRSKSTRTLAESLEDVDRELMRLEADTLPETNIRIGSQSARDDQEKVSSAKSTKRDSPGTKENGTGSTNFLLTIPEEDNNYCMTESSECRKPCKTYIRKSCSEMFTNKRIQSRCYHYSTNDLDYSPDISPDRMSDENDFIPVRPDPVAVTKILGIQRKISTALDSISFELDRIPLPDGENDLLRRQQRVVEFSTRLSRNYLYDLSRQITDIQRHIRAINPNGKFKLSRRGIILHMQAMEQKLISAHQLLLTALSAYWKHIPSSVLRNHPGKLKDILQVVVQLKNICNEINLSPDFYCSGDDRDAFLGKETENRCSAILSKFRPFSDNESQAPSHTTRSTVATPSRKKKEQNRKNILSNRLSMYTMDMRLTKSYQPKKSQSMFQIPRDRKHHCVAIKQQNNTPAFKKSRMPQFSKTSAEGVGTKINKISLPMKEDEIQTIMETVPSDAIAESPRSCRSGKKTEAYKESHETAISTKEYERLSRNKINNIKETMKDDNTREKCFSSLLPVLGDLLSLVQHNESNSKSLPTTSVDTLYGFLQKCQPKISNGSQEGVITGVKNMRLICYSAEKDEENRQFFETKEKEESVKLDDVSYQAHHLKNDETYKLLVSESSTLCLINYRNQCQNMLKSNPLYTSGTQNKPWEIVAWIADKLVDELIVELSDDFQMEDVIQKLFDLEFQEF